MTFDIHTTRYVTAQQLRMLNARAIESESPCAQPADVITGLDGEMYVVQEAKVDSENDVVRARLLVNIGMIPSLWIEMSLDDYKMLPSIEVPGEDSVFEDLPLAVQDSSLES